MAEAAGIPPTEIWSGNQNLGWSHSKESLMPGPGTDYKQESRPGSSSFVGGTGHPSGKQIPEDLALLL